MSEKLRYSGHAERRRVLVVDAPQLSVDRYLQSCRRHPILHGVPRRVRSMKRLDNGDFELLRIETDRRGQREVTTVTLVITERGPMQAQIDIVAATWMADMKPTMFGKTLRKTLDYTLGKVAKSAEEDLRRVLPWRVTEVAGRDLG